MKCVAFSHFTSIDWFSPSYSITERNTFEATITSNPCVRVDIITRRLKLPMKINLRLVLLRLNTPQTYSTSRRFHNVSSVKTNFVHANAAELPTAQSRKTYTSSFKKLKYWDNEDLRKSACGQRPAPGRRGWARVSHPSSAAPAAAGARHSPPPRPAEAGAGPAPGESPHPVLSLAESLRGRGSRAGSRMDARPQRTGGARRETARSVPARPQAGRRRRSVSYRGRLLLWCRSPGPAPRRARARPRARSAEEGWGPRGALDGAGRGRLRPGDLHAPPPASSAAGSAASAGPSSCLRARRPRGWEKRPKPPPLRPPLRPRDPRAATYAAGTTAPPALAGGAPLPSSPPPLTYTHRAYPRPPPLPPSAAAAAPATRAPGGRAGLTPPPCPPRSRRSPLTPGRGSPRPAVRRHARARAPLPTRRGGSGGGGARGRRSREMSGSLPLPPSAGSASYSGGSQ